MIVQEQHRISGASAPLRPRERIISEGARALSDRELLAVVLGSGSTACDVYTLAGRVLAVLDGDNYASPPETLMQIGGMGPAKATLLAAALELGRRVLAPRNYRIRQPGDAVPLLQHYADRPQEHFITVSLNGAHEVERIRVVSIGLVNRTLVHPREVFAGALTDRATAIVCAHNHPSGNVNPSDDDRLVTRSLTEAGEVVGIRLLDHIIFSPSGYYSFLDHGEV